MNHRATVLHDHVGSYGIPMRGGFGSRDTGTVDALGGLPGAEPASDFSPKESLENRKVSWLVTGTWLLWLFHHIGNVIIPTDELICFRGVGQPPTSKWWTSIKWLHMVLIKEFGNEQEHNYWFQVQATKKGTTSPEMWDLTTTHVVYSGGYHGDIM